MRHGQTIPTLRRRLNRARLIVAIVVALPLAGCGYHISGSPETEPGYRWHSLYRDDVKTVAVPIFANRTFYQGVEFTLSKAVVNELEAQSPYKVVPKERADTILEGEVSTVRIRTVSRNRVSAVPQEQMALITVNFRWRDLRSGRVLVERRAFEQTAPYYPTLGEDRWVSEQQSVERLALAIVQELQADWGDTHTKPPSAPDDNSFPYEPATAPDDSPQAPAPLETVPPVTAPANNPAGSPAHADEKVQ